MITQKEFLEACNGASYYHTGRKILDKMLVIPKVYYDRMKEDFNHFYSAICRIEDTKLLGDLTQSKLQQEMRSMMEYFTHLNSIYDKLELYSKSLSEDSPDDVAFINRINRLEDKYIELLKTLEPVLPDVDEDTKLTVPTMTGVLNGEYRE